MIIHTPLDGQGKWDIESTAPSSISATIKPSLTPPLGTGPWTYLLLQVQGRVRAGWANSLRCFCVLCSCKPSLLFSYSEGAPPECLGPWNSTFEIQTPSCVLEGLIQSGPSYYSSPSQLRHSLCSNRTGLFSISENKPRQCLLGGDVGVGGFALALSCAWDTLPLGHPMAPMYFIQFSVQMFYPHKNL